MCLGWVSPLCAVFGKGGLKTAETEGYQLRCGAVGTVIGHYADDAAVIKLLGVAEPGVPGAENVAVITGSKPVALLVVDNYPAHIAVEDEITVIGFRRKGDGAQTLILFITENGLEIEVVVIHIDSVAVVFGGVTGHKDVSLAIHGDIADGGQLRQYNILLIGHSVGEAEAVYRVFVEPADAPAAAGMHGHLSRGFIGGAYGAVFEVYEGRHEVGEPDAAVIGGIHIEIFAAKIQFIEAVEDLAVEVIKTPVAPFSYSK